MLITVRVFLRTAQTAMARQSIFCWQLLGEFRTPTLVRSLSASRIFRRAKIRRCGDGSRELPQLPALQVRMEEEDGVEEEEEEEEEVEEEVDHAEEGTFDLDFGPLLGEILQVDKRKV